MKITRNTEEEIRKLKVELISEELKTLRFHMDLNFKMAFAPLAMMVLFFVLCPNSQTNPFFPEDSMEIQDYWPIGFIIVWSGYFFIRSFHFKKRNDQKIEELR